MANRSKGGKEKHVSFEDDQVLPGLNDSNVLRCDICHGKFNDEKTFKKHLAGKKHQKNVIEAEFMANDKAAAAIEDESTDEESTDEDTNEMYCENCDRYFPGYIPFILHMKGSQHAKNEKKQKLKKMLEVMPGVVADDTDDTDEEGFFQIFARCKICDKEFFAPERYKMHLNSAAHKKKEKSEKAMQTLKASYQDKAKSSDDEEFFAKCDLCDKSFNGVLPYHVHMKSKTHLKKVEKKKIADEMKEFWVEDEEEPGYVCKECNKVFKDPSGFKSHLANNSHEKQKVKAALQDFLTAHPEIVFASPINGKDSNGGSDSEDEDGDYFLICKLCHYSFSGPESARDHVKSNKHLSLKKQKKIQKALKGKAEKISDKSDGKQSTEEATEPEKKASVSNKQKNSVDSNAHDFEII